MFSSYKLRVWSVHMYLADNLWKDANEGLYKATSEHIIHRHFSILTALIQAPTG